MALPSTYLTAGDSAQWTYDDTRLSSGWTAQMILTEGVARPVIIAGTVSSGTATFDLTPAASAALDPALWRWAVVLTSGDSSERATVASGSFYIRPNPVSAQPTTSARSMLTLIEAAISDLLTKKGIQSVSYLGASYTRADLKTLYDTRNRLKAEVAAEERAARGEPRSGIRLRRVRLTR